MAATIQSDRREPMDVLYVNHTAEVGGGERSLLTLLAGRTEGLRPCVATPAGPLAAAVRGLGIATTPIIGTAGSLRAHPLHTPRALGELSLAALQVRRAARRRGVRLIHANSVRAGIALGLARPTGAATVVHVRDCLPAGSPLARATAGLIAASATRIVANSRYTARTLQALAPGARVQVVHNPVDLERFDPARIDRARVRARLARELGWTDGEPRLLLGVVAQITPWKGQSTAVEALRLLTAEGIDARLLLVGSVKFRARSTRLDNLAYQSRLRARIAAAGLEGRVHWLGEREDVPELVRALDVLLAPSHEEPFGRTLIEAMALGVPVLATRVGGPPEIVTDGREGFLLPPGQPRAWSDALRRIAQRPELAAELGGAGRRRVLKAFTVKRHSEAMLEVYAQALADIGCAGAPATQLGVGVNGLTIAPRSGRGSPGTAPARRPGSGHDSLRSRL